MYDLTRFRSEEALYKEAKQLLDQFRHANNPPSQEQPGALSKDSLLTVRVKRDGTVAFNYACFAVRAMMVMETSCSEIVFGEAMELEEAGRLSEETALVCRELQNEVAIFIDGLGNKAPQNGEELMDYALKSILKYASVSIVKALGLSDLTLDFQPLLRLGTASRDRHPWRPALTY